MKISKDKNEIKIDWKKNLYIKCKDYFYHNIISIFSIFISNKSIKVNKIIFTSNKIIKEM